MSDAAPDTILIAKELQALWRDRQGRVLLVVPVLLQLIVFPHAATLEVKHNTLAIFNEDLGAESTELVQRFAQAGAFSKILMLTSLAANWMFRRRFAS